MTVTATPIFPQALKNTCITIIPATTTTAVTAYTAGANGSRIENWTLSNTDSAAAYLIQVSFTISATAYLICSVNVPLSSGNTATAPAINVMANANFAILPNDSNGNPYIYLASGTTLTINSTTTVNTSKAVTSVIYASDY